MAKPKPMLSKHLNFNVKLPSTPFCTSFFPTTNRQKCGIANTLTVRKTKHCGFCHLKRSDTYMLNSAKSNLYS